MKKVYLLLLLIFSCYSIFGAVEKIRLSYNDDPSTTIVIGWDQNGGSNPVVYYDVTDHGTTTGSYAFQKTPDRIITHKSMDHNFARITGLTPGTAYYFVIADDQGSTARYWFKTISNDPTVPLTIVGGGDSRTNRSARQNANLLVSKLRPDFVIFGGDYTELNLSGEWQDWFDDWQLTISSDGKMHPIVATRGNHEWSNDDVYNMFDTPSSDAYYAITFGGSLLRMYTLNTEMSITGTQTQWLDGDLTSTGNSVDWKFAQYHRPARPHVSSKPELEDVRLNWSTLFYNNDVRLVCESDAHTVKQTWPVKPSTATGSTEGFVREDFKGTVYIGEGCWGAPLRGNDDDKVWTRASGMFNSFNWIKVEQTKVQIRRINTDNATSVGSVDDNFPFTAPTSLDIWNPASGDLVEILNEKYIGRPEISITYPANGQYFTTLQSLQIDASATDTNGTVVSVDFYVNGTLLGTSNASPYNYSWNPLVDGVYEIEAIATDDQGNGNISQTVVVYMGSVGTTAQVNSSGNDAEEDKADGSVDLNSSDLELSIEDNVWPTSDDDQWVGIRFNDLNIPQGSVISSAYIQFTVDETNSDPATSTIYAELSPNAQPFYSLNSNISARTRTSSTITWSIPNWTSTGLAGTDQQTPDISSLVQEIVDQSNYVQGNPMVFLFEGTGTRAAESFDGDPLYAPVLHVNFSANTSSVSSINNRPDIRLFPNPNNGTFQVEIRDLDFDKYDLSIYDIQGKQIASFEKQMNKTWYSAVEWQADSGTYFCHIHINGDIWIRKIVINK